MKIIDFYKNILEDVDITTDDNGFLKIEKDGNEIFITRKKGKKVLLPTKDNINNFYIEVEGEMVPKGLLFNPLKETISSENIGCDIYRDAVINKIIMMITTLGNNFILCLSNPETQGDLGLELNQCFTNLRRNVPGMKKTNSVIGDETMIKNWVKMIDNLTSDPEEEFVKILTSNDKNKIYSKIGKVLITIYEELNKIDEEEKIKIANVTLRPKDRIVFSAIIKLLIQDIDDKGVSYENTEVKELPVFTTLLNMFYKISNRYKNLIDALKHVDTATANKCVIKHEFKREFINDLYNKFNFEISSLPTENEINGTQKVLTVVNKVNGGKDLNISNENKLIDYTEVKSNSNPLRDMLKNKHPELYFGRFGQMPQQQFQQPMMGQGMPQNMFQQPMNMFQTPGNFQQTNMFQQPMMGQGINNFNQNNQNGFMQSAKPKPETPDNFELKSDKKMVSVLDPSLNVGVYPNNYNMTGAPMVNMGMPQNNYNHMVFQQPMNGMYNAQPMMGQGMYQPMTQYGWR